MYDSVVGARALSYLEGRADKLVVISVAVKERRTFQTVFREDFKVVHQKQDEPSSTHPSESARLCSPIDLLK